MVNSVSKNALSSFKKYYFFLINCFINLKKKLFYSFFIKNKKHMKNALLFRRHSYLYDYNI